MKNMKNQAGSSHIVVILLVVLIAAVGLVGWKVWDNKDTKQYPTVSQNDSGSNGSDQSDTSTKQITISEWGVQFDTPATIPDLKVDSLKDYPAEGSLEASSVVILDSPALEAAGKIKTTGTQERHEKLGKIIRQKSGTVYYPGTTIEEFAATNNFAGVKIGDYFYVYETTYASDNAETYLNAIKSSIETSLRSVN